MMTFFAKFYILIMFALFFNLLGIAALKILHLPSYTLSIELFIATGCACFVMLHLTEED